MTNAQPLIILIEADFRSANEIERILISKGYRVVIIDDGKKGVEYCRSVAPNLIILGFDRPPEEASFVLETLIKDSITAKTPILGLYSKINRYEIEKDRKRGIIDYLTKPINKYHLHTKVKELLDYSVEMKNFSINHRKHHIIIENPLENLLKISFKSGLKKYVLPEIRNFITPDFLIANKDKSICIDIRDFTALSEEEILILERIVALFKDKRISLIVGKHMGTIISNSSLEETVNLFISTEDFVVFLKKDKEK